MQAATLPLGRTVGRPRPLILVALVVGLLALVPDLAHAGQGISPVQACEVGPAGRWKLDEIAGPLAFDSSPNGHDGTIFGGVTQGVPGVQATAYTFDGVLGTHVEISDAGQTPAELLPQQLTLSVWVNPSSLTTCNGGTCAVVANEGTLGSGEIGYGLRLNPNSAGTDSVQWCIAATGGPGRCAYAAAGLVPESAWTHIVGTYDGTDGQMQIYVNGLAAGDGLSGSASPVVPSAYRTFSTTEPLYIGKLPDPALGFEFKGSVDDLQIYDRVLTEAEITGLFALAIPTCIDIQPGSARNKVKMRGISVAILSDAAAGFFPVGNANPLANVDSSTLRFGVAGDETSLYRCWAGRRGGQDYNNDGFEDLYCSFFTLETGLNGYLHQKGDMIDLVLTGKTFGGDAIQGVDFIMLAANVPKTPFSYSVPATSGISPNAPFSTGLMIDGTATVTASGSVVWRAAPTAGSPTGPDGDDGTYAFHCPDTSTFGGTCVDPSSPFMALIAQVGNGPLQFVGAGPTQITGLGELKFYVNDYLGTSGDNFGTFEVTVVFP